MELGGREDAALWIAIRLMNGCLVCGEIRGGLFQPERPFPGFAALNPGYACWSSGARPHYADGNKQQYEPGRVTMMQHPMSRRTMLKGATALGALLATPHGLACPADARAIREGPERAAAAARRVRHPWRHRADHGPQDRRSRDRRRACARRCDRRGRGQGRCAEGAGHRRRRHDLHAGLHRHPLASVGQPVAAVRARRRSRARILRRDQPARPALRARGQLSRREARHRRSAERRCHHRAQLGAQRAVAGPCRRRARRHARRRHPRPVRLRPRARDGE